MKFFGLDIGSHSIKVIELEKKGNDYYLSNFGSCLSASRGLLSESEADLNELAVKIKQLREAAKIQTKNVATALPQDQVFTRVITMPKLSEAELSSALKWEAEQFVPIPLEEAVLAHQIVGEFNNDGKQEIKVLLVAAPSRLVDKIVKVVEAAGLNPISLEVEMVSLARSLAIPEKDTSLIVDLGATATDLAVVKNGQIIFVYSIPSAGEALTRALTTGLGLEASQAESYKKTYGVNPQSLEGKILEAINPVLESIVGEIRKSISFFQDSEKGVAIERVILTGGTAGLPEIGNLLAQKLGLEIQLGDPFSRIIKDEKVSGVPAGEIILYGVAVGLALKQVD